MPASPLSPDELTEYGIASRHERMDNGEVRFRLVGSDGSGYIRTVAPETGGWQNSHYHKGVLETYIVQDGWAAMVELVEGESRWMILKPGDVYTTSIGVAHNLFVPAGAVLHTVKHGTSIGNVDWYESPDLDALTKHISQEDVLARVSGPANDTTDQRTQN